MCTVQAKSLCSAPCGVRIPLRRDFISIEDSGKVSKYHKQALSITEQLKCMFQRRQPTPYYAPHSPVLPKTISKRLTLNVVYFSKTVTANLVGSPSSIKTDGNATMSMGKRSMDRCSSKYNRSSIYYHGCYHSRARYCGCGYGQCSNRRHGEESHAVTNKIRSYSRDVHTSNKSRSPMHQRLLLSFLPFLKGPSSESVFSLDNDNSYNPGEHLYHAECDTV